MLIYLVGTTNLGLWYEKGTTYDVKGYCDADFAEDIVERKSTSGYCCFLGKALITWSSKSRTQLLSQLLKLNMYLQQIVMLRLYRLSISWRILT